MRRKNITTLGVVALSALLAGGAQAQTLTALTSFGNNGYLAPVAGTLDTGSLTRGLAWVAGDAFSGSAGNGRGNLVVVNREGGLNIKVIDGLSGQVQSGELNDSVISGGFWTASMAGSSTDGKIYVSNMVTNSTSTNFKVYEYDSLTSGNAPVLVFDSTLAPAGVTTPRLGDTMDVRGSGASTELLFGVSGGTGYYHFTRSSTSGPFTATYYNPAGSALNQHRLGITFAQGNTVLGTQGGTTSSVSTIGGARTGALALLDINERLLDHVEIQGVNYLATVQTLGTPGNNTVRVYNINDPLGPVLVSSLNLIGDGTANGNGVGQIRWGAVNGSVATLYAMNTNNGIQAMQFDAVPEPATMTLLALGALAARRRRKNSK